MEYHKLGKRLRQLGIRHRISAEGSCRETTLSSRRHDYYASESCEASSVVLGLRRNDDMLHIQSESILGNRRQITIGGSLQMETRIQQNESIRESLLFMPPITKNEEIGCQINTLRVRRVFHDSILLSLS